MNFIEYLGIALAPSLTLGLAVFLIKNWFLERLKNSIKHEYDLSLEKFKGDLKIENDKELEEIKALLKKQTDVNLEDYRFQIEIRKKWISDIKDESTKYLGSIKEQTNLINEYLIDVDRVTAEELDKKHYQILEKLSQMTVERTMNQFKLEILLQSENLHNYKTVNIFNNIQKWLKDDLMDHLYNKTNIDPESSNYAEFLLNINNFKILIIEIVKLKSDKL
ncbi:hypothetical protein [Acinetobacter bereziniae]|uniref:hypothetical protein n=1 Tax=Acinetobacter bereziniae TaxID=106648 RepID=UPI003AF87F30